MAAKTVNAALIWASSAGVLPTNNSLSTADAKVFKYILYPYLNKSIAVGSV
jgi:hypothetical protein